MDNEKDKEEEHPKTEQLGEAKQEELHGWINALIFPLHAAFTWHLQGEKQKGDSWIWPDAWQSTPYRK